MSNEETACYFVWETDPVYTRRESELISARRGVCHEEGVQMAITTSQTIQRCKDILESHYGPRFKGLVLYGSVAREQASVGSDIDLLVLLSEPYDHFDELYRIIDLLYPVQLESDQLVSAKPAAEAEFEAGRWQLYRNAKREGRFL
jgi:predicted nucleotidyltransferase